MFLLLGSDSVDTKTALDAIRELITATNVYLDAKRRASVTPERFVLRNIAVYVTRMFRVRHARRTATECRLLWMGSSLGLTHWV